MIGILLLTTLVACSPPMALRDQVATAVAGANGTLSIVAAGTPVLPSATWDLGNQAQDQPYDVSFTLKNTADADLSFPPGAVSITGAGASAFAVLADPPTTIRAGGTGTFTVRFLPATMTTYKATVSVKSSDSQRANYSFALQGTGTLWHGVQTVLSGVNATSVQVGVNGTAVYLLYYDVGLGKMRVVKSSDSGSTWGSPYTITSLTGSNGSWNALVVDGTTLDVAYLESDKVYFIQVIDGGSSFSTQNAKTLSTDGTYPYGYEPSLAVDNSTIYVVFSQGGGPVITAATKALTLSFSAPRYIDSGLATSSAGNRKVTSTWVDGSAKVYTAYADQSLSTAQLRLTSFLLTDTLPKASVGPAPASLGPITSAGTPSYATDGPGGAGSFASYYDLTNKRYMAYYTYKYVSGLNLFTTWKSQIVDSSSTNVGQWGTLSYVAGTALTSYYDATNKSVKFARGSFPTTTSASSTFTFQTQTLATVGGVSPNQHMVADASSNSVYVVFSDSTGTKSLRLAKSIDNGVTW